VLSKNTYTSKWFIIKNVILQTCPDNDVCVYSTLTEYIKRTSVLRNSENNLLISYIHPHKSIVSTTVSRWIKCVMKNSGIEVEKFKAHSSRCAVTSKAKQSGLPITDIMKIAGWSTDMTFARFYDKPLEKDSSCSFQEATLQN